MECFVTSQVPARTQSQKNISSSRVLHQSSVISSTSPISLPNQLHHHHSVRMSAVENMILEQEQRKIEELAQEYISWDPNPQTRDEIAKLLAAKNWPALKPKMTQRMEFGTAGLRSRMAGGYDAMNDLTVIQAAQGLCKAAEQLEPDRLRRNGVIIGYDARHNSKRFAELTACVFASRGHHVHLLNRFVPTPFVPFGIGHLGCACGIMVTASHNPREDNGYKVYWSNGCQIVPPLDSIIAKSIEQNLAPWFSYDPDHIRENTSVNDPTDDVANSYMDTIQEKLCFTKSDNSSRGLRVVYTPVHGVGAAWATRAFQSFHHPAFVPTPEQIEPNPDFPTAPYPNPEAGKGVLAPAMAAADKHACPVVVANDPDADRLAVAERQADGTWKIFNGNEIGALLGHWLWLHRATFSGGRMLEASRYAMLVSTVSSKFLAAMAKREGFHVQETLTGFKWLGTHARDLAAKGYVPLFAFEEAIGYMCGTVVTDKDGISAAGVFTEMAGAVYAQGGTLATQLQHLYAHYGRFETLNASFPVTGPKHIATIFDRVRNAGTYVPELPLSCGRKLKVTAVRDLTTGFDSNYADQRARLPVSSSTQMVTFHSQVALESRPDTPVDLVFTLRTSGTEPKVKLYSEATHSQASAQELSAMLADVAAAVKATFIEGK